MTNHLNDGAFNIAGRRASTLTAFFDNRGDAEAAVDKLKAAGVTGVRLMPGYEADSESAVAAAEGSGFWSKLGDWFFPDEDRDVYAEGLRRGGFLVSVSVDSNNYDTAHDILDDEGSIDMDERADTWRTDGWTAGRDQQAAETKNDVFQADAAAGAATGGRYMRSTEATSARVRAYELTEELPDDVLDDVLPTGHQRDVSEGERPMSQEQSIDDIRRGQWLPGSR
ncbi:hypothetical protein [Rhizobium sp. Root1220]|uniref:hypothetical protein n=1 Tax=Rhizobium sp. Root1220 TaxID=1736432 RepID=UPI000700B008|nr:hypothetical protein [Rhizobium sp. Root1220]KQV82064.1 hypothetical protein ASC90_23385 [Rhizobium sp. Root1220]